jgi:hypothetical protein
MCSAEEARAMLRGEPPFAPLRVSQLVLHAEQGLTRGRPCWPPYRRWQRTQAWRTCSSSTRRSTRPRP